MAAALRGFSRLRALLQPVPCEQGVHTRMGFQGVRRLGVAKPYYRIKVIGDTFLQC